MPAPLELSLSRIRNARNLDDSTFINAYAKLFRRDDLGKAELINLLSYAVIFLQCNDPQLNRLGYRMVLQYSDVTGDLEPLMRVAMAKEYMPIVEMVERIGSQDEDETFVGAFFSAHRENFQVSSSQTDTYRTRGQMDLRFFAETNANTVVVAPTSYGKSELLTAKVKRSLGGAVCIVVPTKALISQTKNMLLEDEFLRSERTRIITHPDAFNKSSNFVAVLTQERLFRLLRQNPELTLDVVLVDEAHNLLSGDERAELLSQVLLLAIHRNANVEISYYTPFLSDISNLQNAVAPRTLAGRAVDEHVKIEQLHYTKLEKGELYLYDQFLDRSFLLQKEIPRNELDAVVSLAGRKNLIYVNRPRQAESLAIALARRRPAAASQMLEDAVAAIADLIHPDYSLIECIRRGVLFHHGKVPELLRQYIEDLFARTTDQAPAFLVTTSTLLEGVNTPADTMFILTPQRGRGYLTRSAFKNLIGRVGRFKEIFRPGDQRLDLLQPKIYLLDGETSPAAFGILTYLKRVTDVRKLTSDNVENALLYESTKSERRTALLEFLENVEMGATNLEAPRRAVTLLGSLCFKNNVLDFDIFENEMIMQGNLGLIDQRPISNVADILKAITSIFLTGTNLDQAPDLKRLRDHESARNFYSLFLDWRAQGAPYKQMVAHFLRYWQEITDEYVYVGTAWGDETGGEDGYLKLFVRMRTKSRQERVNLAVAKIKEEHDFVDFKLLPYIEILNDLELMDESLYNRIKYGTDDPYLIALLKNGLSHELSRLISARYRTYVSVVPESSLLDFSTALPAVMLANEENAILIFEIECLI